MKSDPNDGSCEELRIFCGDAALQILELQARWRALVAATERQPELLVLEEAVESSLRIARAMLDAGQRRHHGTLLALRPLLRVLSATRF